MSFETLVKVIFSVAVGGMAADIVDRELERRTYCKYWHCPKVSRDRWEKFITQSDDITNFMVVLYKIADNPFTQSDLLRATHNIRLQGCPPLTCTSGYDIAGFDGFGVYRGEPITKEEMEKFARFKKQYFDSENVLKGLQPIKKSFDEMTYLDKIYWPRIVKEEYRCRNAKY
jgi:hypothetical protein